MTDHRSPSTGLLLARLRRRAVLRGLSAAAALALRPFAAAARAASPELVEVPVNPAGRLEAVYALSGAVPGAPVKSLGGPIAKRLAEMPRVQAMTLRLFHFNDMHNFLASRDAAKGETHALAQMVKRVRRARAKAAPDEVVLLLSAGDDRSGGEFDKLLGDVFGNGFSVDPSYTAYSAAGVDAAALGNHEFDHGARTLRTGIRQSARFPLLSANLSGCRELQAGRDYHPAAVAVAAGLRIGLIGLITPVTKHYRKSGEADLTVASPSDALAEILPAIADLSDVVIVLSHCGYGEDYGPPRASDGWRFYIREGDIPLAHAAAKLTGKPVVIVGGHTHTVLNKTALEPENLIDGVPILQTGAHGKYLGEAVLTLRAGEKTKFAARLYATRTRDDTLDRDDPDFAKREHDGDFDGEFDAQTIVPLRRRLKG
jgi:2',3'-cyclic-nucleotide 2'-phosphodiesterase (5'-nucleotidase family)